MLKQQNRHTQERISEMEERSAEIFQNAPQRDKEIKYIEKNR